MQLAIELTVKVFHNRLIYLNTHTHTNKHTQIHKYTHTHIPSHFHSVPRAEGEMTNCVLFFSPFRLAANRTLKQHYLGTRMLFYLLYPALTAVQLTTLIVYTRIWSLNHVYGD